MGELLFFLFILTAPLDANLAGPFFRAAPTIPLAIWWAVGATQLFLGFYKYGFWAMRDATSLVESLFLWVGFVVADVPNAIPRIVKWFDRVLGAAVLIAFTYPLRETITALSPVIISAQMKATPLFFTYQLTSVATLTAAVRAALSDARLGSLPVAWLGGAIFIFVAALFQARTIYLQILLLIVLLALTKRGSAARLLVPMAGAVALFAVIVLLGVPIPGRLSGNVSLSFYLEHFLAIGGDTTGTEDEAVRGAAGGVGQRLNWWSAIWTNITSSWERTMFGLGYGISLVGLAHDTSIDPAVREPHNSLISALGRTGFVGLFAYICVHIGLIVTGLRTYWSYTAKGFQRISLFLYVFGVLCLLLWIAAIGEDAFEKPYVAIPYYFLFGVVLNLWYRDKFRSAPASEMR